MTSCSGSWTKHDEKIRTTRPTKTTRSFHEEENSLNTSDAWEGGPSSIDPVRRAAAPPVRRARAVLECERRTFGQVEGACGGRGDGTTSRGIQECSATGDPATGRHPRRLEGRARS